MLPQPDRLGTPVAQTLRLSPVASVPPHARAATLGRVQYGTSSRIHSARWSCTGPVQPLFGSTSFMSSPLNDLAKWAKLRLPTGTYLAQFSVTDDYFAYSTYDAWSGLGA